MENIFPNKEQFDTMNRLLAAIASNSGGIEIKAWSDVQALVRQNLHSKAFAVADQFQSERATSVSAGIGNSTGITAVSVDETALVEKLGSNLNGTFVLTYDGNVWLNQIGASVNLKNWGITVTGTPAKDDEIVINVTATTLTFDVLDFDKHKPKNNALAHTIDLCLHDVFAYGTIPFSAPQLMYYTDVELPAGKYKFTLDHAAYNNGTAYDGTYMFTTTQPIPATGGFRHTNPIGGWKEKYAQSDVLGNYITTYGASPARTTVEKGLTVSVWDGSTDCFDLGTFTSQKLDYHTNDGKHNFTERQAYGSNRWRDSVYRQWLNSDAAAVPSSDTTTISNWWTPQNVFDMIPGGAKLAGFLHGLDPTLVKAMGEVEIKTALHACDRVGDATYDITYDKVFLLSRKNVFGADEYSGISEGELLEYFNGATNADRIKYQNGTARYWWLRTPGSGFANSVRGVFTSGALSNYYAYGADGVVPACCII